MVRKIDWCNNGRIICPELNIILRLITKNITMWTQNIIICLKGITEDTKCGICTYTLAKPALIYCQVGWILMAYKGFYTMVTGIGTYYPVLRLQ